MKLIRAMLLLAAVVATSVTARAAISSVSPGWPAAMPVSVHCPEPGGDAEFCLPDSGSEGLSSDPLEPDLFCGYFDWSRSRSDVLFDPYAALSADEDEAIEIQDLPAPPGGASLLLSGLLSLGAIGAVRSVKQLHLGSLPAWYHEACPERIGHTVAFDFDLADMPVCFTAQVAAADVTDHAPAFHEYLRESRSRIESQFILPVIAPRGPPAVA